MRMISSPRSRRVGLLSLGVGLALAGCGRSGSAPGAPASQTAQPAPSPSESPAMTKVQAPTVTLAADLANVSADDAIAFDPASKRWAISGQGKLALGEGTAAATTSLAPSESVFALAWTRDGQALLAAPRVFDLATNAWRPLPSLEAALTSGLAEPPSPETLALVAAALSPDGKDLVIGARFQPTRELGKKDSYRGPAERLLLLDAATGALRAVLAAGTGELRAVTIGDALIAAGGAPTLVWDRATGAKRFELPTKFTARALAFSPDGKQLAALTAVGDVSLWDAATGAALGGFHAHDGDGYALAFHPTEPWLATGGQDGKLRLSLLTPSVKGTIGALLDEQTLGGWVKSVAFSPDGATLAAGTWARPPHLFLFSIAR